MVSEDTSGITASVNVGEFYMRLFRDEVKALQKEGFKKTIELEKGKKKYEDLTPNFFNLVLLFSALIALVAFFYILREIKIRLKYQKELERRLVELNRSYAELEQFAFVASHDLQEPLRKIRTFSDRLLSRYASQLEPKGKDIVERMDLSAARLQELIQDITNFSALIDKEEPTTITDLNELIQSILAEYNGVITERNISIFIDALPDLLGYKRQLRLLFTAVIDNAIKFTNVSENPVIQIRYALIEKGNVEEGAALAQSYHKITIEDNGIGFDNEFAEKIFMIFQRLHTQQSKYRGKGMGLAIAQRVMVNHNGFVLAKGDPGKGASFNLFFPFKSE